MRRVTLYSLSVFLLAASFYLYEYTLQVAPSVMTHSLMVDFDIDAAGLSLIAAFFFYAYAPLQIPAGLLYDRFGPRTLLTFATLICAMGAVFFAATHSAGLAAVGRLLMGAGAAFSFIGIIILLARWFEPHHFAMMAGIAQMMSSVGAVAGEIPLAHMSASLGWRSSTLVLAAIGFVLAALIWLVVRDAPEGYVVDDHPSNDHNEWDRFRIVISKPQTWAVALYAFAIWVPIAVFAGLWAVPFIKTLYHVNTAAASEADSMIWIGVAIGSPFFGWLSDRLSRRKLPLLICASIGLVAAIFVIYVPMNISLMWLMLFLIGVGAGGQTVSFAVVKENNLHAHMGTAAGINNMAVLASGMIFHPIIGYLLRLNWDGSTVSGAPIYSIAAYQQGLISVPLCFGLAVIASAFFIRETYTKEYQG